MVSWPSLLKPSRRGEEGKFPYRNRDFPHSKKKDIARQNREKHTQEMQWWAGCCLSAAESSWIRPLAQPASQKDALIALQVLAPKGQSFLPRTSSCIFPPFSKLRGKTELLRAEGEPCSQAACSTGRLLPPQGNRPSQQVCPPTLGKHLRTLLI